VSGKSVSLYSVERRINIHNQRDRSKGRSTKDKINLATNKVERKGEGEIFRYDAIDAGQTFQAVVLCDTNEYDVIEKLLNSKDDIWLGGSQSAGYGYCKISDIKTIDDNWNEIGIPAANRTNKDNFVITLLSNAIFRDDCGQTIANPHLVKDEIKKILGIKNELKIKAIYAGSENIGGFNRKWGLPLPQVPALKMGSVFVFEDFSLTEEQVKLLESIGIGERRVDGFGRISVNWLSESKFDAKKADQKGKLDESQLQGDSLILAEKMSDRLLRQKLDRKLLEQIGRISIQEGISNSQLSRLRLFARQALPDNSQLVLDMLNDLPKNAQKQLETKIKVGNRETPLKLQIETWLQNPQEWITNVEAVKIANVEKGLTDVLAMEYTLRLIEAMAKKATKEDKEDE
jgi:CRISPR-associated protein Csx10